jgi:hypothetical protein
VGDCDLAERFLRAELAPLFRVGIGVRYVPGNHDVDAEAVWADLVGDFPEGNPSERVDELGCLTVAGLGGTFEAPLRCPSRGVLRRSGPAGSNTKASDPTRTGRAWSSSTAPASCRTI